MVMSVQPTGYGGHDIIHYPCCLKAGLTQSSF